MKKFLIYFLFVFIIISTSCSKEASKSQQALEAPVTENEEIIGLEEIKDIKDNEEQEEFEDPNKIISPLDGLKYYPEELNKMPLAISLDNHPKARWQAGLKDAEIVYEFQVEYPYTRYLAIFLAKEPKQVGPVRSARPYIIYYAMENDAVFVHVGGSEDAFSEIKRLKVQDVDGLYSSAMYRYYETEKYAPHNMYTTLKAIRAEAKRLGYSTEGIVEQYSFNDKSKKLSEKYSVVAANKINITYNNENTTSYVYDDSLKLYKRFKDNQRHLDELDNEQLTAKNILVLEAPKSVLDSVGRLYLDTIGKGKGIYFTQKESCEISWVKESEKARTKFYINGEELNLNPGNSWIQIVDSLGTVTQE